MLAAALVIVGIQVFFSSFLLSILGLRRVPGGLCLDAPSARLGPASRSWLVSRALACRRPSDPVTKDGGLPCRSRSTSSHPTPLRPRCRAVPALSTLQPKRTASANVDDERMLSDRPARLGEPGWRGRCFPGDRRMRAGGLIALLVITVRRCRAVAPARRCTRGRTRSAPGARRSTCRVGRRLCMSAGDPARHRRIELEYLGPAPRPRIDATAGRRRDRERAPGRLAAASSTSTSPRRPTRSRLPEGRCASPRESNAYPRRHARPAGRPSPWSAGADVATRVALWYSRLPARTDDAARVPPDRSPAALFRPGWVGPWTYWFLLGLVHPVLGYVAVDCWRARRRRARSIPCAPFAVGLIALANGLPSRRSRPRSRRPTSREHAAYVAVPGGDGAQAELSAGRGEYSTEEPLAIEADLAPVSSMSGSTAAAMAAASTRRAGAQPAAHASVDTARQRGGPRRRHHRPGYYLAPRLRTGCAGRGLLHRRSGRCGWCRR